MEIYPEINKLQNSFQQLKNGRVIEIDYYFIGEILERHKS